MTAAARSSVLIRLVRVAIFGVAGAAAMGLLWMWPPGRGALLYAAHRTSICGFKQTVHAHGHLSRLHARTTSLSKAITMVRREGDVELWNTSDGAYWVPAGTDPENFARIMAEDDLRLYGSGDLGVKAGDVVIDCGAAQGTFTRDSLERGARVVLAVEPLPINLECLRRTFAREIGQGRVVLSPKALWDSAGTAEFSVSSNPYESTLVGGGAKKIQVELTTVDHLVQEIGLERVDFMKLDVEGAERRVLAGAAGVLRSHRPRLGVSVNHLPDDVRVLPELIRDLNPRYNVQCGVCSDRGFSIAAEVIYAH